jgi:hypothetical protein
MRGCIGFPCIYPRFAADLEESLEELRVADPATYDAALDLLACRATEPSFLGVAGHLFYVGRTGLWTCTTGNHHIVD